MAVLSSGAFKRLSKEILQLIQDPPEGIRLALPDYDDVLSFVGWVEGPAGTPYENGYWAIRFSFSADFPSSPPKCWFTTKIFHPNVNESTGEICVSTLKKDWQSDYGIAHILQTVKCLLIAPNPESALNEEAGKMLLERYEDYTRHARLMTSIHATRQPLDLARPFKPMPVASTSKLDQKARSRSPSSTRGLSPEVSMTTFPTMPLQASHSTNSINNDEGSQPAAGTSSGQISPGNSKKRTLSSAIGKPTTVMGGAEAPEAKKAATSNPVNKKRGLKRL